MCKVVLVFPLFISGCYVQSYYKGEKSFKEEQISKIRPGETTKQEVLLWFGPPVAIAEKGRSLKIPSPYGNKEHPDEMRSEDFFKLFSAHHEFAEFHRIYYYHCGGTETAPVYIIYSDRGEKRTLVDQLWVLINIETGIVEDYIFKKQR